MTRPNLVTRILEWQNHLRVMQMAEQVKNKEPASPSRPPVIFFNASARISGLSQNAAFSLLTSWGLRLGGVPIRHFVCNQGMSRCVLGTQRGDPAKPPPCAACMRQSKRIYHGSDAYRFSYQRDEDLAAELSELDIESLSRFEYTKIKGSLITPGLSLPLGKLVMPSARWALRRHNLDDDEPTRHLLVEYLLSAYHIALEFSAYIDQVKPSAVVVFNGMMYPEAVVRWISLTRGIRVVTYEVGFQRFSAFFTEGEATAYPIVIPDDFYLNPSQEERLDHYLEQRFQGHFTMAGIRFWPEMRKLDKVFQEKADHYRQVVPIFTNVVFDTSQVHANTLFPDMFSWLDSLLEIIESHQDTLFVVRAHPDEMRPGTAKQSRESVREWIKTSGAASLHNLHFVDSQDYLSSYELIRQSKFIMVYNSSIGLEATLINKPVLCGGRARYTQYPIVYFPENIEHFREKAEDFLQAERIDIPPEFVQNARRFLYCQLFRSSISFEPYLKDGYRKGYVRLRSFSWQDLHPENSETIQLLLKGIDGMGLSQETRLRTKENNEIQPPFIVEEI